MIGIKIPKIDVVAQKKIFKPSFLPSFYQEIQSQKLQSAPWLI